MEINALTHSAVAIENVIKTQIKVTNTVTNKEINSLAIWDTGATNSVITKSAASALGLIPMSMASVSGVHGTKIVNVYLVKITLNNENISITTQVTECEELSSKNDTAMLIGMNIINLGDFHISNYNGQTVMTFRVPSLERTDYVQEIAEHNRCLKIHQINERKGMTDKCGCGSGKQYKNCHGNSPYSK